jgi:hypothetical protein
LFEGSLLTMADKFDPYREALVVETSTIWPDQYDDLEPAFKHRVEDQLHAEPAKAGHLEYVRLHTGFLRQITVTSEDLEQVS